MSKLSAMPPVGLTVIVVILAIIVFALFPIG